VGPTKIQKKLANKFEKDFKKFKIKRTNFILWMKWVLLKAQRKKKKELPKCGERGSNTRPSDLQSDALPTELSPL
jgi:hypothetical protein